MFSYDDDNEYMHALLISSMAYITIYVNTHICIFTEYPIRLLKFSFLGYHEVFGLT